MAKDILMPMLSPSMTEGTLAKWIKKEGDAIKQGDVLAEVETDKATMDLEAFDSGFLRKILIQEGEKVPINTRIGIIGSKDEAIDLSAPVKPEAATATPPKKEEAKTPAAVPMTATQVAPSDGSRIKASPLAKKNRQGRRDQPRHSHRFRTGRPDRQKRCPQRPGQWPRFQRFVHLSSWSGRQRRRAKTQHHTVGDRQAPPRK
jgi:pyruvate/2-oxoglutarate dehydrogenase complex dihydrolipoamide acyltransferase (E2) component